MRVISNLALTLITNLTDPALAMAAPVHVGVAAPAEAAAFLALPGPLGRLPVVAGDARPFY